MERIVVMNVCAKHPPFDGRVYDKICGTLIKCGYEVHNSSPNIEDQLTDKGIYLHGFTQGAGMPNRVKSLAKLFNVIKTIKPDVMIGHEPDALFVSYVYYIKEKGKRKIKLYFDCHEAYEHWFDNATKVKVINKLIGKMLMITINAIVKRIDGVTSVNNTMAKRFEKYNDNSYFLPSVYSVDGTMEYESNHSTDLVYMGQFGKSKQIEMFVGAAKILKEKGVKFKIAIIGGDKEGQNTSESFQNIIAKEQVTEYFDVLGWLPREKAFQELKKYGVGIMRFDSYTMPGNYAMPNKLFEYMSMGLAILGCDLNLEIKEIVEAEKCGVLIRDESAESLACAISFIYSHKNEIESMKKNSFIATVEKYNWDNYKSILKKIVE